MLAPINTILYACDLEGQTQSALELVMNLALAHQAKVIIMHSMEPLSTQTNSMIYNYVSAEVSKKMQEEAVRNVKERMDQQLDRFMEEHKDTLAALTSTPERLIVNGIASDAIQYTAEEKGADMIVMNSRTHSRIGQMIIGSTANKIIHHSKIPVLVVPIK
ncbi:universal stress protein [Marinomonas pollencensis]|uniref:Nucleotide-binding universal stress UspA family protein n=1 Tax=Marinomonas pollencensis TaxID=491954 RepID=A0A3E0DXE5_9GAMM|nr:universal stress protein [Marinomonas pollencensis]REG86771.1 nucleotide-binding universal stress UspA family protein [Marinomonas pollencensis]